MNKLLMIFICIALCVTQNVPASTNKAFLSLTRLDEMHRRLDSGVTVEKVYYTDGYGFSTSEFTTTDPEEITALVTALTAMKLGEKVNEGITDWYPQIVFYLSDGSRYNVCFDAHWLEIGGMTHYAVSQDAAFWEITARLVKQYSGSGSF